jgi:choline dehydrogenase-like flavoprotein
MTMLDARELTPATTITGDICIVGAGVAGVTLAMELARSSARVVLLESGGLEFTKSLRSLPTILRRHLLGEQRLARGRNAGLAYYPLRFTRARAFGGTSRAWASHGLQAAPLDEIDFEPRAGLPHHGWPFERKHLDPYYERAQRICNLGPFEYDVTSWEHRGLGTAMPLDDQRIRSTMFQFGLDSSFDRFERPLADAPNVQVVTHATAIRIATSDGGGVAHVHGATLERNTFAVEADTFVLAAGAIENARLLLASDGGHGRGVGNEYDLVGRFFMEHPDVEVGFFIPDRELMADDFTLYTSQPVSDAVNAHAMLRPSDAVLMREHLLNSVIRLRRTYPSAMSAAARSARAIRRSVHHGVPTADLVAHTARALRHAGQLVGHQLRKRSSAPTVLGLDIMSEQGPNPYSRVRLGQRRDRFDLPVTVLDWRLDQRDWHSIRRACELLGECVADAGIGTVVCTLDDQPGRPAVFGNWHHLGTTRMHTDPSKGVVDEHCRVHGVDNLYVAGGSVFPTGGYANPTLTIAALALRLADRLRTAT